MARTPPSSEGFSWRQAETLTEIEEIQLKRFQCIKEFLLMLDSKRPIDVGSPVLTLDPELEYQNLMIVGKNQDGTFQVAHKSKPDFPIKNLSPEVLFDQQDFVDANREAWRRFPQMSGESYEGPSVNEAQVPKGRE
ncbi:MAG: hypothetical protein Q8R07_03075 [Candidatus Uhrbacteria bacterium]|nr:hypothetical protein [Candidatus Uhrbacteria bacterium]